MESVCACQAHMWWPEWISVQYAHSCIDYAPFLPVGIFDNTDPEAENKWIDKRRRTYTGLGDEFSYWEVLF